MGISIVSQGLRSLFGPTSLSLVSPFPPFPFHNLSNCAHLTTLHTHTHTHTHTSPPPPPHTLTHTRTRTCTHAHPHQHTGAVQDAVQEHYNDALREIRAATNPDPSVSSSSSSTSSSSSHGFTAAEGHSGEGQHDGAVFGRGTVVNYNSSSNSSSGIAFGEEEGHGAGGSKVRRKSSLLVAMGCRY